MSLNILSEERHVGNKEWRPLKWEKAYISITDFISDRHELLCQIQYSTQSYEYNGDLSSFPPGE
jgi:hypothetical protein